MPAKKLGSGPQPLLHSKSPGDAYLTGCYGLKVKCAPQAHVLNSWSS